VFFQNSVGTEYARFNSSGNLGIGISSPSFPLTVLSPSITSIAIAVNGRSSDNSGVLAFYANDGSTQYATITATAAEFRLSSVPAATVQTFFTNSSERMRIDASGNVGIGTSSINGRLNLAVGASTACTLRFTSNGTGAGSGDRGRLDFYSADNSGTAYQLGYMDYDRADGTGTASYIAFANRVSGTVAERMRINSSGLVGINTSSPTRRLHVSSPSATKLGLATGAIFTDSANDGGVLIGSDFTVGFIQGCNAAGTSSKDIMMQYEGSNVMINSAANINFAAASKLFVLGNGTGMAVGYGTSTSQYRTFYMNSGDATLYFHNNSNYASLSSAGTWTNASDVRLKKNIVDIKYGLADVLKMQPRSYQMNDVAGDFIGFVAQELQTVIPEVVSGDPEKQLGVDYGSLVAVAFKAIQEQQALITQLQADVAALKAK
jgi:hypothetical protein